MDVALDRALEVFRDRGYHEASLLELGSAMRLTAGSIYKAFRGKREIFVAVLDRYRRRRDERLIPRLEQKMTAKEKIAEILGYYSELASGAEGRIGCLVVGAAADLSTLDPAIVSHIANALDRNETFFAELIALGYADGSIPVSVDPAPTAAALLCLTQGMRITGKVGRTHGHMMAVVNQAMKLLS